VASNSLSRHTKNSIGDPPSLHAGWPIRTRPLGPGRTAAALSYFVLCSKVLVLCGNYRWLLWYTSVYQPV